jgi:hypothetical protein
MANSVQTVRVADVTNALGWVTVGAGGDEAALSDDDATTYLQSSSGSPGTTTSLQATMGSFVPDATDAVKYIQPWLSVLLAGGVTADVTLRVYSADETRRLYDLTVTVDAPGAGRYTHIPLYGWPDGTAFSTEDLAGMIFRVQAVTVAGTNLNDVHLTELGLDIVFNSAPTVVIAADSLEPHPAQIRHGFAYADGEADPQERIKDWIFQQPAGGWPSGTADEQLAALVAADAQPVFYEEKVTDLPYTSKAVMPPSGTFRRYIAAADEGSGQRFGAYDVEQFTMDTPLALRPRLPVPVAAVHMETAKVSFSVTSTMIDSGGNPAPIPPHYGDPPDHYELQYSTDGGVTWADVIASPFTWEGEPTRFEDRFAPRATAIVYRIRSRVTDNGNNTDYGPDTHTSVWVQLNPVTLTSDGNSWLQTLDDVGLDLACCHVGGTWQPTKSEDVSVFAAEGRADSIVFGGTIHGRSGTVTLALLNDDDWDTFEQIRALRSKVLFRTLYGDGPLLDYWIRIGAVVGEGFAYNIAGDGGQVRTVTFPVSEVTTPTGGD